MINEPGDSPNDSKSEPHKHRVEKVAANTVGAVSLSLALPFLVVWRALRAIWADSNSRNVLIGAAWLLLAGTIIFMIIEGLSLLDSFYFSFITLATIGYGDISPTTDLGKVVAVIYAIAGLGVIAALFSSIASLHLGIGRRLKERGDAHDGGSEDSA